VFFFGAKRISFDCRRVCYPSGPARFDLRSQTPMCALGDRKIPANWAKSSMAPFV